MFVVKMWMKWLDPNPSNEQGTKVVLVQFVGLSETESGGLY